MILKIKSLVMSLILCFLSLFGTKAAIPFRMAAPVGLSEYTGIDSDLVQDADFYVSTKGSDDNDGSFASPFATIEKARNYIRTLDKSGLTGITVAVMQGDYRISSIEFTAEDSGTESCPITYCAYGDGEVVLNGGATLSPSMFQKITDTKMLGRLSVKAQKNVRCINLSEVGITLADYGKIYAVGTYSTAFKYEGDTTGPLYAELFVNDCRQNLARWPDSGYTSLGKPVFTGEGYESDGASTVNPNWNSIVNPKSDIYKVTKTIANKVSSWETLDDVWMMGFWKYDWADGSSPIDYFDKSTSELSPKYVSFYGTKNNAPVYFYNVFEELDKPGEWYLDRTNNILYLYPDTNLQDCVIDLSLTTENVLRCTNTQYITFKGFTVKATRGDGIEIQGNHMEVSGCLIKNVARNALIMSGYNNVVRDNEITRTGMGGILLQGGDRQTLTPGNNIAENNLIHDWSEIYLTYQPAILLDDVGNTCAHNEIYNSPHEAITYKGNNHIIEYNVIHDVCLLSDDAGAIYSGRHWDWYGNVIRYNCIYNLGSGNHTPDGIYMDDALSGQTIYGNLLVNVPKIGLHLGGGRDLNVRNNIVINTSDRPISYDQRALDGLSGGWFTFSRKDGGLWTGLKTAPLDTQIWQNAFPEMVRIHDNFDRTDDPDFGPNPAYSTVSGNLIINAGKNIGFISQGAKTYSSVDGNAVFRLTKLSQIFVSPETGNYSLKQNSPVYNQIPAFENLPISEMGRH